MNVAVLGIGLLGRAVAERLLTCGHTVVVYNRTKSKAAALAELGAQIADSPKSAIRRASHVILLLSDANAIRQVLRDVDPDRGLRGRTIIQMGTIGSAESRRLAEQVSQQQGDYVEAPVLGSLGEAKAGRLLVMVGGQPDQFEGVKPMLAVLGEEPMLIGPVGQAAALKLALNQLIAAQISAYSLSLGLLTRVGVPADRFRAILEQSALSAPMFEKKFPRLQGRTYDHPNFSVRHLLKDVRLFLKEAKAVELDTSSLEGVPGLLHKAIALRHGEDDYSAIYEAINPLLSPAPAPSPSRSPSPRSAQSSKRSRSQTKRPRPVRRTRQKAHQKKK